MAWRIVEIPDTATNTSDLTNAELVGVSILLNFNCGDPRDESNVYWRAFEKLAPYTEVACEK